MIKSKNNSPLAGFTLWPLVLIAPLVWAPVPSVLVGHPWKPELVLSAFLLAALCRAPVAEEMWREATRLGIVVLPVVLFTLWSGISAAWATSAYSAAHHTLTWAAYLIFFLFVSAAYRSQERLIIEVKSIAIIIFVLTSVCLIEYFLRSEIDETFGFRYARFAEIWAALLPLCGAYALGGRTSQRCGWAIGLFILLTSGVVASQSRGSLIAAVAGVVIFAGVAISISRTKASLITGTLAVAAVVVIAAAMQLPAYLSSDTNATSTLKRFAKSTQDDPGNSLARNIRIMFYRMGLEMVRDRPLTGIGADNFWLRANEYREKVSAPPENRSIVEGNEGAIPERAHNEYLQVAAELGIPGLIIFGAFLLAVLGLGCRSVWRHRRDPDVLLRIGALAGMCAFLLSSAYSSFSFRLVQNGLVFFFLAAYLLREEESEGDVLPKANGGTAVRLIGLLAMVGLFAFSSAKGVSQYMTYRAEREATIEAAGSDLLLAKKIDPDNYAADAVYGMLLFNHGYYDSSAGYLGSAVSHGIGTSTVYSYLISARYLANDIGGALTDAAAGVRLFPYSAFMRTRYGVLLDEAGQPELANEQFRAAEDVDARQAASWRLLITQGPGPTADAGRNGVGMAKISDMQPQPGVYAIIAERNVLHPEEKSEFLGGPGK